MSYKKRVFYRIFPTEKIDFNYIKLDETCNKIYALHLQGLSKRRMRNEASYWEFDTNGIFFNSSQETVYDKVEEGVLKNVINGNNAIIVAFGQTKTGKTFTTSGLHLTEEEFGILPRIGSDLLELKKQEPKNIKIDVQMSYVEFYNTYAIDLFEDYPNAIETYKCRDVRRVSVSTQVDILKCLFIGEGRKNVVESSKYLSNIATSVATFHIARKNMDLTNPTKVCSRLHIVDLVGNDSCANIAHIHKNPRDIGLANVTKSQLEQFLLCLSENIPENIRVKQRTNALIYYLDGDFSCETILRFIGHIRVKKDDLVITLSMLRFGNTVQGLKMKKRVMPFEVNEEMELTYLRTKLKSIEKEKHLNSVLLNQDLISGMNPARVTHLNNLVNDYLANGIQEITVMNVADIKVVLQHIKEICRGYQNDVKKLQTENQILVAQQNSDTSLKQKSSKTSSQNSGNKLSRRSSKIRSKDSISREKGRSDNLLSEKRIKGSRSEDMIENSVALTSQKRKKSMKSSSSAFNKQSSQSKRKSSNTSVDKRDSRSSVKSSPENQMPIPDIIPEKQDLWKRFNNLGSYKEKVEEYKQNEKEVRNSFICYVRELKKLQSWRDDLDKRSNELIMAQTYRKFNYKDEYDEDGNLILSFAENECKGHLEEAEELLLEQQEKVLITQAILKVYLENRRNIIKRAEEDFDQYCSDNSRIPSADVVFVQNDMNTYTFHVDIERPDVISEQPEEIMVVPETPSATQVIRNLQRIMSRERKKRKQIIEKKNNEWKNM